MPAVCAVTGSDVTVGGERGDRGGLAAGQGGQQAGGALRAADGDRGRGRRLTGRRTPVSARRVVSVQLLVVDLRSGCGFTSSSRGESTARQRRTHRPRRNRLRSSPLCSHVHFTVAQWKPNSRSLSVEKAPNVSQGSVATRLRRGGIYNET